MAAARVEVLAGCLAAAAVEMATESTDTEEMVDVEEAEKTPEATSAVALVQVTLEASSEAGEVACAEVQEVVGPR